MAPIADGRLAIRQEGEFMCAYYAARDTMEGAILIATIRAGVSAERRAAFEALMRDVVRDLIEEGRRRP